MIAILSLRKYSDSTSMPRGIFDWEEMSTDIPSCGVDSTREGARGVAKAEETLGTMGGVKGMQRAQELKYLYNKPSSRRATSS